MNILEQLAAHAALRAAEDQASIPLPEMQALAGAADGREAGCFRAALQRQGLSLICEIKRASPSKGLIARDFYPVQIARDYQAAGADCISCLTEPKWFLGSDGVFRDVRAAAETPILRKDFTVDAYQIYQAKAMGADAVLLIAAILDAKTLERFLGVCRDLGLDALVEAHNEAEIDAAVAAGARIIGVNNRNLRDFSVDFGNAARLRGRIPPDRLYVAESGVASPADAAALREIGADAALVGEVLMRAKDRIAMIRALREAAR